MTFDGFMSDEELSWLSEQARKMESIVEIGCWKGLSTNALLQACIGPVWAVDHFLGSPSERLTNHREVAWTDIHAQFLENVGHYPNLLTLKMDSLEACSLFANNSIDMIFIDGDHEFAAVVADIKSWYPKCKKLMSGHDRDLSGVQDAIKEVGFTVDFGSGSIWYIEK